MTFRPSPDDILTRDEVAARLKIKPRQVQRLGIPCINLGRKTPRYLWGDVLKELEERRSTPAARSRGGARERDDAT